MMSMYEMRKAMDKLGDVETEADVLLVVASEAGTVVVAPFYECELTEDELQSAIIRETALVADKLGEGYCIGAVIDKREKA